MTRSLRLSLVFIFSTVSAFAQHRGYYSFPDVRGDVVVFSSEGDLWRVPVSGGTASRMTRDAGIEAQPHISPDGTQLAFAAQYDGSFDVYVMPMDGGVPKRLTWHPYSDIPTGWTPDGKSILYHSARRHPEANRETFIVPATGGVPMQLPIGSSSYAHMDKDGKTIVFNRGLQQGRTWARYGGGTADDVWIGDIGKKEFRKLTEYFGNDLSPNFAGDRIVFTSERDGRMNLWSITRTGKDLRQLTRFTDFDVRFPSSDGGNQVVFQQGADIYLYRVEEAALVKLDILLPTDRDELRTRTPDAKKFVEDFSINNGGQRVLFSVRGDIHNIPSKTGLPIPVVETQGIRETKATFAGKDDEFAVYYSDKSGDYEIYKCDARTGANEVQLTGGKAGGKHFLQPHFPIVVSPDGGKIAWADPTGALYSTSITTPTLTLVAQSRLGEIREYDWSPDGRHLAYAERMANDYRHIAIYTEATGGTTVVTDEMFDSFSPAWDPQGKFLFYLSGRTFNRQDGAFEYETVMVDPVKIYAIPLDKDTESPFRQPDYYEGEDEKKAREKEKEEKEKKESPKGNDSATSSTAAREGTKKSDGDSTATERKKTPKKDEKKGPETKIDFDGIATRAIEFPGDAGELSGLTAAKDRLFFFAGEDDSAALFSYSYKKDKPKTEVFAAKCESYSISRDRGHIAYRVGDAYRIAATSAARADEDDPSPNLGRIHLFVDPQKEWMQILREAFRYNRDYFYASDMAKVDWPAEYEKYKGLLGRLSARMELTDLIGSMISELGHGHTYVLGGGDGPAARSVDTGLLGVDFDVNTSPSVVVMKKIFRGERWSPALSSPFDSKDAANIKDGSVLLAVNGRTVTTDVDPLSHFWGLAGEEVLLKIADDPTTTTSHNIRVRLLKDELPLREYEWVRKNREYVAAKSGGRIGYVYLPDMGTAGLNAFFREFMPQSYRNALVVDVRWNGGGNVSQLIIRRLRQELYAMTGRRNFDLEDRYPARAFVGPMACLINEYAGSDGDIFSDSFRHFKLGPLIGKRTWGGVVGIRNHTKFVDGSGISVPEFAFIDLEKGYGLENHGVDPDEGFEVDLTPEDEVAGRDPQLDRAIDYLLNEMKKDKYAVPAKPKETLDRSTESFRKRSRDWLDKP
ncbi:PD40 domain-containing protein [Candidatus Sumerlaeota bacterium]|nr:PD40 domain-containing protein [Candidatus Sumerlaeota bacterium]